MAEFPLVRVRQLEHIVPQVEVQVPMLWEVVGSLPLARAPEAGVPRIPRVVVAQLANPPQSSGMLMSLF